MKIFYIAPSTKLKVKIGIICLLLNFLALVKFSENSRKYGKFIKDALKKCGFFGIIIIAEISAIFLHNFW